MAGRKTDMSDEPFLPECNAIQPELDAYLDGELAPPEQRSVERHLEECAACRAELELLRAVTGSLRQVERPAPSEAMRRRLFAQVAADLPLRRMEIVSTERHGDRVFHRHEVRLTREPVLLRPPAPISVPAAGRAIRQFRRVLADRPNHYQVVESYYGRDYHERRA
jgi:anti-sigma factor RsiW